MDFFYGSKDLGILLFKMQLLMQAAAVHSKCASWVMQLCNSLQAARFKLKRRFSPGTNYGPTSVMVNGCRTSPTTNGGVCVFLNSCLAFCRGLHVYIFCRLTNRL